jgi:hypothetical protein
VPAWLGENTNLHAGVATLLLTRPFVRSDRSEPGPPRSAHRLRQEPAAPPTPAPRGAAASRAPTRRRRARAARLTRLDELCRVRRRARRARWPPDEIGASRRRASRDGASGCIERSGGASVSERSRGAHAFLTNVDDAAACGRLSSRSVILFSTRGGHGA